MAEFEILPRNISILGRGGRCLVRLHFRNTAAQPIHYSMFRASLRLKRPELEAEHYPRSHDVVHGHKDVVVYSVDATELFTPVSSIRRQHVRI